MGTGAIRAGPLEEEASGRRWGSGIDMTVGKYTAAGRELVEAGREHRQGM